MTVPSRTITAPNGKSAWRASSMAMRMKRTSSADAPSVCACAAIGEMAAHARPARKERRLEAAVARWQAQP
jgi:hypothetical protein